MAVKWQNPYVFLNSYSIMDLASGSPRIDNCLILSKKRRVDAMTENYNPSGDYTVFGGWLLVWYWCLIAGGVLSILSMVIPALVSIAASFLIGFIYAIGILISIASICVAAVFEIQAALQLKARKAQFFDTLLLGIFISLAGSILSSLFKIRGFFGIGNFFGSVISSVIGVAIGLCLYIMYFSKSVRVATYFGGRPLQQSQYWAWIRLLPDFIISDAKLGS